MNQEEKTQAKWHLEYVKQQRKYFEYSDASQYLLEQKKDEDLLLIQDSFVNWMDKIKKDDPRKKELTLLLQSVWRIQSYCGTLETVCKSSVSKVVEMNKLIQRLESEKKLLELELVQVNAKHKIEKGKLEKEIEFISKNS
jgi:predicted transcriptional regulator with HTH domain